jgi:hypothetical protein
MAGHRSPSSIGLRFFRQADYAGRPGELAADLELALAEGYRVLVIDDRRQVVLTGEPSHRLPWRDAARWYYATAQQAIEGGAGLRGGKAQDMPILRGPWEDGLDVLHRDEK